MSRRGGEPDEISMQEFTEKVLLGMLVGCFLLVISMTVFPVWTRRVWGWFFGQIQTITDWMLTGASGEIVVSLALIVLAMIYIGGAFLLLEKIYIWAKSRFKDDELVNEYQIK